MTTQIELTGRLIAAAAVIACILGALRIAIARMPRGLVRGRACELAVIETAFLPNGSSLHVVGAGDRRFVIARSANAFALICELGGPSPMHAADRDV